MLKTSLMIITLMLTLASAETFYKVLRAVDGDTYIIDMGSTTERVRISGIDTPEVYPKSATEPWGPEASAFAKELLTGQYVRLEIGTLMRDHFGRLLATVYLQDERDVALLLLQAGFAEVTIEFLESKHVLLYSAAVQGAYSASKGLWAGKGTFRDRNCKSFRYQEEAQAYFLAAQTAQYRDRNRLDPDRDGVACQRLPTAPVPYVPEAEPLPQS